MEDYAAEVLAMRNGKMDLGQFGPRIRLRQPEGRLGRWSPSAQRRRNSARTPRVSGSPRTAPSRTSKVRGKSLALFSMGSTSGDVLPRFGLRQAGIADADLKMDYAGGHPEALLALKNSKVEAAEIDSQTLATAKAGVRSTPTTSAGSERPARP